MIECKSIKGNTFPLANLTQYNLMLSYSEVDGVFPAVIVWFIDHDKIIYVPLDVISELKKE